MPNSAIPQHDSSSSTEKKQPDSWVVMGRITAPYGVKGWVKVYVQTAQLDSLLDYSTWWLRSGDGAWREVSVEAAKVHSGTLVAQLAGVADRDAAISLKGHEVAVLREQLPAPEASEFYWADLIGLKVVNVQGHEFGHVARILQTGANDVLVVAGEPETLIPFISGAIEKVDIAAGLISVDWSKDY